jgi:hypothetical protein
MMEVPMYQVMMKDRANRREEAETQVAPFATAPRLRRGGLLALSTLVALGVAACGGDSDAAEDMDSEGWTDEYGQAWEDEGGWDAPDMAVIPAGTHLVFEVQEDVSTATHEPGERFTLRLVEGVEGENGAALPAGTTARGIVTESARSAGAEEEAVLAIQIASVSTGNGYMDLNGQVESADVDAAARDSGQRSAAKVATGAAAGAIIGQVLGRDTRSTVTGAAVGAAAGLGIALTTRDGHAVLPEGARVPVRLDEPIVM